MNRFPTIVAAAAALALTGGALTACGSSDAQSTGTDGEGPRGSSSPATPLPTRSTSWISRTGWWA